MSKSKYVMIKQGGLEQPFVFSETLQHADVARALTNGDLTQVVSAGFCHINMDGKYTCYGDSWSLKLKSREEDSRVINQMLNPEW